MATARQNIILTGFMGTGKTEVGRIIANTLAAEFVDTDEMIEAAHGSIPELFATRGEDEFRDIERATVARLLDGTPRVIATGGGTLLDFETARVLTATGPAYTLTASPTEILRRVDADGLTRRPLLAGDDPEARIGELLSERAPIYGQFTQVRTDGRDPQAIAAEIVNDAANRSAVTLTPERRQRRLGLTAIVAILVVLVVAAMFALLAGIFVSGGVDDGPRVDVAALELDPPADAPPADSYMRLIPILESGPDVDRRLSDWIGGVQGQPVPGSAVHVAAAVSPFGQVDIYEWEVDEMEGIPQGSAFCRGTLGDSGGSTSCGEEDAIGPQVGRGRTSVGEFDVRHDATVSGAPEEAIWWVVESQTGWRIVSEIVGDYGYVEYDGQFGAPVLATIYDTDHNEIFSSRFG